MTDNHQLHSHVRDVKEETKETGIRDTGEGGQDTVYKLPPLMNNLSKPPIVIEMMHKNINNKSLQQPH